MAILSKAQQKVIDAMAGGETLRWYAPDGLMNAWANTSVSRWVTRVSIQTFDFLNRNKFIEEAEKSKHSTIYRLTELGKSKVTPKKN